VFVCVCVCMCVCIFVRVCVRVCVCACVCVCVFVSVCVCERVCACVCCTISSAPHICVCIYILHTRIQIQGVVATFSASLSSLFFSSQPLTLAFHTWQLKLVSLVSCLFLACWTSVTHAYTHLIVAHSLIVSLSIILQWNKQLSRLFEPDLIIIHSPEVPARPFSISAPLSRSLPLSFFVCYPCLSFPTACALRRLRMHREDSSWNLIFW